MHRYLLYNGEIREAGENLVSPGQVGLLNGWGVFSTIRVKSGVLFAFERHFARMRRDASLMRVPFPADPSWMRDRLLQLVEANKAEDSTLRVAVVRNKGGLFDDPVSRPAFDLIAFTKDLADWGQGVRLGIVPQARHAESKYAGTKVLSWSMNLTWYEEARERGLDEVVLLNERDEVAECTSANIFASFGDRVWTPPLTAGCLPGVTRDILLSDIHVDGIQIGERTLRIEDLEAADEVFITSTTRDLLPVPEIEGLRIKQQGTAMDRLLAAFRKYQENYVYAKAGAPSA